MRFADFPSVLFAGDKSRLCDVRASDAAFPLRGTLTVRDGAGREQVAHAPAPGTVYVDHAVLVALDVAIGDTRAARRSRAAHRRRNRRARRTAATCSASRRAC